MQFIYRCANHGDFEDTFRVGQAPTSVPCRTCHTPTTRVFTAPHFQEDRTRLWRDGNGGRYSAAFGGELPDSKAEIQALAKQRGIELDAHEMPHIKRAVEAGRAVRSGENLTSRDVFAHINEPKEPAPTLVETLRKSGRQQAIAERIAVGYENWRDRGALSGAEMARKGAEAIGSGMSLLNDGKPV